MPQVKDKKVIEGWKQEYKIKEVIEIVVYKPNESDTTKLDEFYAYCRKPSIQVLGLYKKYEDNDPAKAWEVLYANTKIHADEEIEKDEELKMAVIVQMTNLFTHYLSQVKKL